MTTLTTYTIPKASWCRNKIADGLQAERAFNALFHTGNLFGIPLSCYQRFHLLNRLIACLSRLALALELYYRWVKLYKPLAWFCTGTLLGYLPSAFLRPTGDFFDAALQSRTRGARAGKCGARP